MKTIRWPDQSAETVVVAKDLEARDRVQARLETLFADSFPDVRARISRLELGPPVGWPVQYRVSAPTTDEARDHAEELAKILRSSGLVRNVNYDWAEKSKELRIVVDVEPLITRLSAWATRAIAMQVTTSRSCAGVAAGRSVPTSRGG